MRLSGFQDFAENDQSDRLRSQDAIIVHFADGSAMEFDTLERETIRERKFQPVRPDWFVNEVKDHRGVLGGHQEAEAKAKAKRVDRAQQLRMLQELKRHIIERPVENMTDPELFSTISGAPLAICEDVLIAYEGNLARMASASGRHMQKVKGIGKTRSDKISAAFELGKRLATFHAKKEKITSPSDVADLMMSKMRYLTKEVVCVLCLDTKGGVTTTGTAGNVSDIRWGKMIAESQIFEGTLNASVFHPREIFRFAIEECANSVILVHNHPSGDPQPSQEDIQGNETTH